MSIVSICSLKSNAQEIAQELKSKSDNIDPILILFFASSHLNVSEISKEIKSIFPSSHIAGCTTAGELISGVMLKDSVVAMLISQDVIDDVQIGVIPEIKEQTDIEPVFSSFETHFGISMSKMGLKKYAGIILLDGLSGAEEKIIERIGDLTDITFIGGSAGDDLTFKQTLLCADGETYTDAAVLILMKLKNGFDIYCNIREGMELDILNSGDIVSDTQKAVSDKLKLHSQLKGIINFHCILRTLELEQNDLCDTYGKIFSQMPMVGFSTYGEAYIGHINQTSTMFVFL